jgi:hypothetical protein
MTRRAVVTRCKGHGHQGQGKDDVAPKTRKGRMLGKRWRTRQESGKWRKYLGCRRPLYLRKQRKTTIGIRWRSSGSGKQRNTREALIWDLRIENLETNGRDFNQDAENDGLDIVEGSAPSGSEEEPNCSASVRRTGNMGVLATRDRFDPTVGKRKKNVWLWWYTWIYWHLSIEHLGASALQEGAVKSVGEWAPQKNRASRRRHGQIPPKGITDGIPVGYSFRISLRRRQCKVYIHC